MFKKIIFVALMVLVPVGLKSEQVDSPSLNVGFKMGELKAQIIECDTLIQCDTTFKGMDSSTFYEIIFPNWQDSIEQCKKEIEGWKAEYEVGFAMPKSAIDLNIWILGLQLQIFELQLKLEGKE